VSDIETNWTSGITLSNSASTVLYSKLAGAKAMIKPRKVTDPATMYMKMRFISDYSMP
jgi:hypothetical protein